MRSPRWPMVVLLAVTFFLAGSMPAWAHDVLVGSDPADGASLNTVPATVSFSFDQPVQNFDPVVAITGPDGVSHTASGVSVLGDVVSAPFGQTAAGGYIAAYRVISADGHPVTGEIHFTVAAGASVGPSSAAAPVVTPTPARTSSALPGWAWIALGAAAVVVVVALLLILRRPARDPD